MPLSWSEIRTRATAFVHEWRGGAHERGEARTFWNAFFDVFGVSRKRLASFEQAVQKLGGRQGFIDLLWPGVLLVEHTSLGEDLAAAYGQALDYVPGLAEDPLPRYVLVSDFARFRLHDLEEGTAVAFPLEDLPGHLDRFAFIAGYAMRRYDEQDPVNVHAAERMGALHDELRAAGYGGHDLEVFLVRLLFCLFADDTGIFTPHGLFQAYVETRPDGSDLGPALDTLFYVLNTPPERRMRTLDEQVAAFPYVDGALFAERLAPAAFDAAMRARLREAAGLDWGAISPALFGSLFQRVMDAEARRSLGAHYTSEKNSLKLIGPLFLDGLRAEFERARKDQAALLRFHDRLASFRLLDPACGCGNFLVGAYRELRRLEAEVLKELQQQQQGLDIAALVRVNVDQCFGIEVEEFPAQIAQVALWLADHQMNLEGGAAFGTYFTRRPLARTAHVLHANALRADWATAFGPDQPARFDVILGNPPFVGKQYQTPGQKADLAAVLHGVPGAGVLDLVAGWYVLAARYMQAHPETRTAFVSTNSVSQGEQVGVLWNELFTRYGAKLHFAHRTFRWDDEARGKAAVHVVIEGFALHDTPGKRLFDYDAVRGEPHERAASNINPYLVEGGDVVVRSRRAPLCDAPPIVFGSMPNDGGHLLLTPDERHALLAAEPAAAPFVRRFVGSQEFLNGLDRYCLWLVDASPQALRRLPEVVRRVEAVRATRLGSSRAATHALAATPALFGEIRQPATDYLLIPSVSSESRPVIPTGFLPPEVIASNLALVVPGAGLYHLGVLSSAMHMAWMRSTAGRLKSDYRYSAGIVYNTFPWPEAGAALRAAIEGAAQAVLDARRPPLDAGATLADLYDPLAMPPALVKAHAALDRAVDRAYRPRPFRSETHRVAFLFDRYEALTSARFAPARPLHVSRTAAGA
jgi:hypothetical protein